MTRRFFCQPALSVCILFCSFLAVAYAQPVVRIVGTVTDVTGGVIPGADVVATEVGTDFSTHGVTDEQGYYVIAGLRVGDYRIECEISGFKKFRPGRGGTGSRSDR